MIRYLLPTFICFIPYSHIDMEHDTLTADLPDTISTTTQLTKVLTRKMDDWSLEFEMVNKRKPDVHDIATATDTVTIPPLSVAMIYTLFGIVPQPDDLQTQTAVCILV